MGRHYIGKVHTLRGEPIDIGSDSLGIARVTEQLPINEITGQLLDRLETALAVLRRAFVDHTSGQDKQ